MQLRVLGAVELRQGGLRGADEQVPLRSAKVRRVLAALAVAHGQVLSVDRLADLLWGQAQPSNPEASVHTVVSRLRAVLKTDEQGQLTVLTRPPGYVLAAARTAVDAHCFEDLVAEARRTLPADAQAAAALLDEALALWHGPAYAEFRDEEFAGPEAVRLEELRAAAGEERVQAALALGDAAAAVRLAEQLVAAHPLRERPQAQLVLALVRCGRQADALRVSREHRERLADELGLEPSAELQRLETAVLRQDPALVGAGPSAAPAADGPPPGAGLPAAPPPLVGRQALLARARRALAAGPVVTLTGPGGVGKTRVAAHLAAAAAQARALPDGVWLVELAALSRPDMVAGAVSAALQVQQRTGLSQVERLVEFLRPKRLWLVLDNCEHVVQAAAELVDAVVRGCPGVTVLSTSREALGVEGELVCPVPPLEVPTGSETTPEQVRGTPAAKLFLLRAAAAGVPVHEHELHSVVGICRRLDGMPLALELAASRLRSTSADELLARLEAGTQVLRNPRRLAEERHRTLRSVVAWSHGLLSEDERAAFDRLSVFAGAFSADAARLVAGADDDLLHALVDKSMVMVERRPAGTRYRLLETLRAYGRTQLTEADEQRTRALHAAHYRARTQAEARRMRGHDVRAAVAAIGADLDEVRTAHAWALVHDLDLALDLVAALVDFVELQLPSEVFTWGEQALEAADAAGRTGPALPLVLTVVASGARFRGELAAAGALAQRALDLLDGPADPRRRFPLSLLCELRLFDGDLAQAAELARQLEQSARSAGDALRVSLAMVCGALAVAYGGDSAGAAAMATSSRLQAERAGDLVGAAWSRYAEGEVRIDTDPPRALALLDRALHEARAVGDRYLVGVTLVSRASLLGRWHDPEPARAAFRDVVEHWHQAGDWTHQWTTLRSVVSLLVRLERDEAAAHVLGALSGVRSAGLFGADAERLTAARTTLVARLGQPRLAALLAGGARLDDHEVVALACGALR